ncbi:MAG: KTSC domain-containing protein [Candidatus Onthovivens sp.]|nr:KTSC domain-containing protein [Candidatus Onthovivens sp.]
MAIENCNCGGNQLNRFYSLFTCNHSNCEECHWTNNKCCNGCYSDSSSNSSNSKCINYYDINMQNVITSKIKAFGYCNNHKALGVQFTDGTKKLYLNVNEDTFKALVDLNKDLLYMFLESNVINPKDDEGNDLPVTCIDIP